MYKKQIEDYIKLGHAKLLSREESSNFSNKTNHIPHYGATNVNKPGTVRVVFDASAKCDNISLNEKLLPAIDYLNSLVGVLTKFRHGKYKHNGWYWENVVTSESYRRRSQCTTFRLER